MGNDILPRCCIAKAEIRLIADFFAFLGNDFLSNKLQPRYKLSQDIPGKRKGLTKGLEKVPKPSLKLTKVSDQTRSKKTLSLTWYSQQDLQYNVIQYTEMSCYGYWQLVLSSYSS